MIVRFSEIDELLNDLDRRATSVVEGVVRVTTKRTLNKLGFHTLTVVVTAKVLADAPFSSAPDYDLVTLEAYVGDLFGGDGGDDVLIERANELADRYRAAIEGTPLFRHAAGVYELAVT